jgi:hypothetical protein
MSCGSGQPGFSTHIKKIKIFHGTSIDYSCTDQTSLFHEIYYSIHYFIGSYNYYV